MTIEELADKICKAVYIANQKTNSYIESGRKRTMGEEQRRKKLGVYPIPPHDFNIRINSKLAKGIIIGLGIVLFIWSFLLLLFLKI